MLGRLVLPLRVVLLFMALIGVLLKTVNGLHNSHVNAVATNQPVNGVVTTRPTDPTKRADHSDKAIKRFWDWFAANANKLHGEGVMASGPNDGIGSHLSEVDPNLGWCASSPGPNGVQPLEITADGDAASIPIIKKLVSSAPRIPGWEIYAFRQADPAIKRLSLNGVRSADVRYCIMDTPKGKEVTLAVVGMNENNLDKKMSAAVDLVDSTIGELSSMANIKLFHACEPQDAPSALKPLSQMRKDFPPINWSPGQP